MKIFAAAVIGLAFSCLLPFSLGQVDHYSMPIVENGTSYAEQIEVDENGGVVIFRVPAHNDVDAADFYYDFKMRVTVTKVPSRMACYIAKMDPSTPSPEKLRADLDRSASQFGQLPVAVRERMTLVTGPADIRELTKEILDFCGALPIYKTENSVNPIREENGILTLIQEPTRRKRRQIPRNFTSCLQSLSKGVDVPLKYIMEGGCIGAPDTWKLLCQLKHLDRDCHYYVQCTQNKTIPEVSESYQWHCEKQHLFGDNLRSFCCDPICPSSTGRK